MDTLITDDGSKVQGNERQRKQNNIIKYNLIEGRVLDNSCRLKDSEIFRKFILSLDLSKEDREVRKKLLADKLKEVNLKGGSKK